MQSVTLPWRIGLVMGAAGLASWWGSPFVLGLLKILIRFVLFVIEGLAACLLFPLYRLAQRYRHRGSQLPAGLLTFEAAVQGLVRLVSKGTTKTAVLVDRGRGRTRGRVLTAGLVAVPLLLWAIHLEPTAEQRAHQRAAEQARREAQPSQAIPPGELRRYPLLQELLAQAMEADDDKSTARIRLTLLRLQQASPPTRPTTPRARHQAEEANKRGLRAMAEGDFTAAVQAFRAAAQDNPARVELLNNVGYAYMKQGDLQAAERWLVQTLTIAPERTNAWANLGDTYAQQGHHQAAIACFAHAYRFSKNRERTRQFLIQRVEDATIDNRVRLAARQALELPLLQGGSSP